MLTPYDFSLIPHDNCTRLVSFGFNAIVELVAEDALPIGVFVSVDRGDMIVEVSDRAHAFFKPGAVLTEKDVQPEDWARLTDRAGV